MHDQHEFLLCECMLSMCLVTCISHKFVYTFHIMLTHVSIHTIHAAMIKKGRDVASLHALGDTLACTEHIHAMLYIFMRTEWFILLKRLRLEDSSRISRTAKPFTRHKTKKLYKI
jgi:hypothetical protein